MPAPLSNDLRIRIAEARAQDAVGRASVDRVLRLVRETGSVEPAPHGGGAPKRIQEAPNGESAHGVVPRNRGRVVTMLGAMSIDGLEALMLVEGHDGAQFATHLSLTRSIHRIDKMHRGPQSMPCLRGTC